MRGHVGRAVVLAGTVPGPGSRWAGVRGPWCLQAKSFSDRDGAEAPPARGGVEPCAEDSKRSGLTDEKGGLRLGARRRTAEAQGPDAGEGRKPEGWPIPEARRRAEAGVLRAARPRQGARG